MSTSSEDSSSGDDVRSVLKTIFSGIAPCNDPACASCTKRKEQEAKRSLDKAAGADSTVEEGIRKKLATPYPLDEAKLKALTPLERFLKLKDAIKIIWLSVSTRAPTWAARPNELSLINARRLLAALECTDEETDYIMAAIESESTELVEYFKVPPAFATIPDIHKRF